MSRLRWAASLMLSLSLVSASASGQRLRPRRTLIPQVSAARAALLWLPWNAWPRSVREAAEGRRPHVDDSDAPPAQISRRWPVLVTSGGMLLGSSYASSVIVGFWTLNSTQSHPWLFIPVLGPFVGAALQPQRRCPSIQVSTGNVITQAIAQPVATTFAGVVCGFSEGENAAVLTTLIADGMSQLIGVFLIVQGLRERAARSDRSALRRVYWSFRPGAPGTSLGLTLSLLHF